jgi:hypothetical protein
VSKEEALQYLKSQKIDEEQAAQIYGLVGGRVMRLKFIADSIKNDTFEGMYTAYPTENRINSYRLYSYAPDDVRRRRPTTQVGWNFSRTSLSQGGSGNYT